MTVSVEIGFALSVLLALDFAAIAFIKAGSHAGRKRMWYRRWGRRVLGINMVLTQAVLVVIYLHVYHP